METEVLEWAARSFASTAASKLGGMAFTEVLALVGIEDANTKMLNQLKEISGALDGVMTSLSQIEERIDQIAGLLVKEIHISAEQITVRLEEKSISTPANEIKSAYGGSVKAQRPKLLKAKATRPSALISLQDLLRRRKNEQTVTPEMISQFMDDILRIWKIHTKVEQLGTGLLGSGTEDGLLRAWTNLFTTKMGEGNLHPQLFSCYEILEHGFLNYLTVQLQGVYLVMMAKCHGEATGTIPKDAQDYLKKDVVEQLLEPEIDLFLWCAEKLALGQGVWRSPYPTTQTLTQPEPKNTGAFRLIGGLGLPADFSKVLLRSELVARRLAEIIRDMKNFAGDGIDLGNHDALKRADGLYAHLLCRQTDVLPETEKYPERGPQLKPWEGGQIYGRLLPATGTVMPRWVSVEEKYAKLAPREQSQLRVARYFWSFTDFSGPFEQNFIYGKPVTSFRTSASQFPKLGIHWHAIDFSRVCQPPKFNSPASAAWTTSAISGLNSSISAEVNGLRLDKPVLSTDPRSSRAVMRLKATQHTDASIRNPHVNQVSFECPLFSFQDERARKLFLNLSMSLSNDRNQVRGGPFQMRSRVTVTLKGPQDKEQELYDSDKSSSNQLNQSGSEESSVTSAINVAETLTLEQYRLLVVASVSHQGYMAPGRWLEIMCRINEVTLSWVEGPSARQAIPAASA